MAGLTEPLGVIEKRLVEIMEELEGMRAGLYIMAEPDHCYGGRLNDTNYAVYRAVGDLLEAHRLLTDETQKLQGAPCGGSKPRPKKKKTNVWGEVIDE